MEQELVCVEQLQTYFYTASGVSKAVDGVSFTMKQGEILGVVGESGSGKSVMASSLIRLLSGKSGKIVGGSITFGGQDILAMTPKELREFRGKGVAVVFQDPMTTLDPVFRVGYQMVEAILAHEDISREEAKRISIHMLKQVGIPDPQKRFEAYPFELSGGMCQRVSIAMVLCGKPRLIIADEPTTALDVTMQAQILRLLKRLQEEYGTSVLLITHNLGVVWEMCNNVMVMYAGKMVERTTVKELYASPLHPYTWGLMDSMPSLNDTPKEPLSTISGTPPDLRTVGTGCNFCARCRYAIPICSEQIPETIELQPGHFVACHRQTVGNPLQREGKQSHGN